MWTQFFHFLTVVSLLFFAVFKKTKNANYAPPPPPIWQGRRGPGAPILTYRGGGGCPRGIPPSAMVDSAPPFRHPKRAIPPWIPPFLPPFRHFLRHSAIKNATPRELFPGTLTSDETIPPAPFRRKMWDSAKDGNVLKHMF